MDDIRLIDANALAEEFVGGECMKSMAEAIADKRFVKAIRQAPTINAVSVVHGRWETKAYTTEDDWGVINHREEVCSECGKWQIERSNFCPHCGAKMDGEAE